MNMPLHEQLTEEDIKLRYITPAIQRKWATKQIFMEKKITDGKIDLKGNIAVRKTAKKADYVLYAKQNIDINTWQPIAVVEAKDNNHAVSDVLWRISCQELF